MPQIPAVGVMTEAEIEELERRRYEAMLRLERSRMGTCQRCGQPGTPMYPIHYDADRNITRHVTRPDHREECPPLPPVQLELEL